MQIICIMKKCKIKNTFLESSNYETYFCPGLIVLPVFYENMHLQEHPQSSNFH